MLITLLYFGVYSPGVLSERGVYEVMLVRKSFTRSPNEAVRVVSEKKMRFNEKDAKRHIMKPNSMCHTEIFSI